MTEFEETFAKLQDMREKRIDEFLDDIQSVSDDRLKAIRADLRVENERRVQTKKRLFRKGQTVTFNARTRGQQTGVIDRINPKNIVVQIGNMRWNVNPSLLEIVPETT